MESSELRGFFLAGGHASRATRGGAAFVFLDLVESIQKLSFLGLEFFFRNSSRLQHHVKLAQLGGQALRFDNALLFDGVMNLASRPNRGRDRREEEFVDDQHGAGIRFGEFN